MNKSSFTTSGANKKPTSNMTAIRTVAPTVSAPTNINQQTTSLPSGWKREEILKPTGLYAGKTDIYYISPTGQKVRSKAELQKLLGLAFDVSNFDWHSGKFLNYRKRSSTSDESASAKIMRMIEEYQQCLARSGPCLFSRDRLPVVEATRADSRVNTDAPAATGESQETPKQIFWHKRLADNFAFNPHTNEKVRSIDLPKEFQNAGVPGIDNNQLFQSIVSCIYNSSKTNVPVLGQSNHKASIEKNPCLLITANQPLVKQIVITDDIINRQEAKVKELRRKLELVRRSLVPKLKVDQAA